MKTLEWINLLQNMKMRGKKAYTLAEIANMGGTTIKNAKVISQRLKKNRILKNIYKNIWAVPEANIYDIAPFLDSGCYCSMESALFHYNMIKQAPQVFHFVSTRFSKMRKTKIGAVYFHKINRKLFFGFVNNMAEPEKALLDYLYFCLKDGRSPFANYDLINLGSLNQQKLTEFSKNFPITVQKYLSKCFASHIR